MRNSHKNTFETFPGCYAYSIVTLLRATMVLLIFVLLTGCDFYAAHVENPARQIGVADYNKDIIEKLIASRKCDEAWRIIWPSVAIGENDAMAALGEYMDSGVLLPPVPVENSDRNRRVSLMLQLEAFGHGFLQNDIRLKQRLLSTEVNQPQGQQIEKCLREAGDSSDRIEMCRDQATKIKVVEKFIDFYTSATKAMNNRRTAQCGSN